MNENAVNTFDAEDIEKNKVISALSYLGVGILFFLPLVACKDSKFGRYHANQALILLISSVALYVVGFILAFIPVIGGIIFWVLRIAMAVLMILGIVGAAQGNAKPLPVIGTLFTILK